MTRSDLIARDKEGPGFSLVNELTPGLRWSFDVRDHAFLGPVILTPSDLELTASVYLGDRRVEKDEMMRTLSYGGGSQTVSTNNAFDSIAQIVSDGRSVAEQQRADYFEIITFVSQLDENTIQDMLNRASSRIGSSINDLFQGLRAPHSSGSKYIDSYEKIKDYGIGHKTPEKPFDKYKGYKHPVSFDKIVPLEGFVPSDGGRGVIVMPTVQLYDDVSGAV